jgi:DNA-binding SARP family transcriptional activator
VTISALRGLLEPTSGRGKSQLLVRTGDAYAVALPPAGYADTIAFAAAIQSWQRLRLSGGMPEQVEALRAALAAYTGDLLPEDGPAEWVVQARERYRRQATAAAAALAGAELQLGHVAEAIAAAEYCINGLDPHDDDAWQVLLQAYARSGAPAKAAEARRRYQEMLSSLGLSGSRGADADGAELRTSGGGPGRTGPGPGGPGQRSPFPPRQLADPAGHRRTV